MIFKRRDKPPLIERLREIVYPRKGLWRGLDYLRKRLHRLPDSPHRIALGFSCGAAVSFTPFFGFHIVIAAAVAWLLRGNILAAAFGTIVGNPLTFPFIAAFALETGWRILGTSAGADGSDFSVGWLLDNIEHIFLPYLVGGILPGLFCGVVCYWFIGPIVAAYQGRRRRRLAARAEAWRAAAFEEQEAYRPNDGADDGANDGEEGDDDRS
ncbi:MAG: DUF2062 domain-containing protein [Proteobacteria bacterium]|nr:DUF2062 domain-containing protein [Pseudomonadota bacterium]